MKGLLLLVGLLVGLVVPGPHAPQGLFTRGEAVRILGEAAQLTDSASVVKGGIPTYTCTFTADAVEPGTGKVGVVYFMHEVYGSAEAAHGKYAGILRSNAGHAGVRELADLGDEAYFHSDDVNFLFLLVRKGAVMVRLKVNKVTGKTSLEEFYRVGREIAEQI